MTAPGGARCVSAAEHLGRACVYQQMARLADGAQDIVSVRTEAPVRLLCPVDGRYYAYTFAKAGRFW